MAIKRYVANADTTITNAYEANLTTRGTGSNMGASDSLEVFSIYGQTISGSAAVKTSELSRILVNFPITTITTDRTNNDIPASGSVDFYLRMFNAEHPFTVPSNFTLSASAVTADWEEGFGLDMETYADLTRDGTGANWMNANGNIAAATLVDAIDVSSVAQNDAFTMTVPTSAGGDGVTYKFLFDSGTDVEANEEANTFGIANWDDDADAAAVLINAINGVADNKYKYGANNLGADSTLTAGTIGLTAAEGSSNTQITLTMDDKGTAGNVANVLAAVVNFAQGSKLLITTFTGGDGPWARPGGDYDLGFITSSFQQTLSEGTEDLEINITPLVEQWVNSAGNVFGDKSSARYGIGIFLTGSQETYWTGSQTNGRLYNPTGSQRSYYTKKFFARDSEFFFKRPIIEARWNSSKKDSRGSFYLSSSLASTENLNTLYLYNYVRGQLKNIPDLGGPASESDVTKTQLNVQVYSTLGADPLTLPLAGGVTTNNHLVITASWVETGVYSASFAYNAADTTIYDVWSTGSTYPYTATEFHTGSAISVKTFKSSNINPNKKYVIDATNLRSVYSNEETARFRLYVREKDWNPAIYTKASQAIENTIIEDGYYKIYRTKDDYIVVDYGTGSLNHTRLSYDVSGSYFDLDMSMLQKDYMYGIKFVFYENGKYTEQPDTFKFRVE